jgi:transposase-like protein
MYKPVTVRQFRRKFRTERDCLRYLIRRKWPDGFRCPRCGHDRAYLIESRKLYQCTRCRHQTSVTAHTIFHKTRKPLRDWFWAIFLVATRSTGSSARQLQYDLGLSYRTAWTWCHKIRKAMEDRDTRYSLRGVMELDDTYIGGKKKPGKRGRGAGGKVPIMVAVESRPKGPGHAALTKMDPFRSEQAKIFLNQKVQKDSTITSDSFPLYSPLAGCFNLSQIPVGNGQDAVNVFPHVHRVIGRLKNWIRGTHFHVSKKHLNRYLAEFSYRFNRRFEQRRATIFDRLVTACCTTQTITYRQLVAELSP